MGIAAKLSAPDRAFVLHGYPYRETSLVAELFTARHGRLPVVAKGAKRPGSKLRAVLLTLQPLEVVWSGRGEVRTLTQAHWVPGQAWLTGRALLCGLYLNELILKLLPREDPHPHLFEAYAAALLTLGELGQDAEQAAVLRDFEVTLLAELGYGLELRHDVITGEPLRADALYRYHPLRGPSREGSGEVVSGAVLLALAEGRFASATLAEEARRFVRRIIDMHLEWRRLRSADVAAELRDLAFRLETTSPVRRRSKTEGLHT
ncbi:MAG: DNA repair protein RecO [Casimicrobiaceae bacterium]|nr:DNA repair protein RecO [Casimicrobiaceae bacterium]